MRTLNIDGIEISVDRPNDGSINVHVDTVEGSDVPTIRFFIDNRLIGADEARNSTERLTWT